MSTPFQPSRGSLAHIKNALLPVLTTIQHFPTPFITTFLMVHLSAPLVANLGGSALSSQVMLLGREYYQGQLSEPLLVFVPLGVHITSSLLKRALRPIKSTHRPSLLTATAYPLLFFLPLHIFTHRILPTSPEPPILSLSPSELDYEFVKAGLQGWKFISWGSYIGLVGCALMHATEGWKVVWRTWVSGVQPAKGRMKPGISRYVAGGLVAAIFSGLVMISSEERLAGRTILTRIHAVYKGAFLY